MSNIIYGGDPVEKVSIGGQAVLEGVMMKYKDKYAVAVRKPDKDIGCSLIPVSRVSSSSESSAVLFVKYGIFDSSKDIKVAYHKRCK